MGKSNAILSKFRFCHPTVTCDLMKKYSTSFFGAVTWKFSDGFSNPLNNKFKIMLRHCFKLSNTTHSSLILCIAKCLPVVATVYMRFINFFFNMVNSKNKLIKFFGNLGQVSSLTVTGNNFAHICSIFKSCPSASYVKIIRRRITRHYQYDATVIAKAAVLLELVDCIGGDGFVPGFTYEELEVLYESISCN